MILLYTLLMIGMMIFLGQILVGFRSQKVQE